MKYFLLSAFLLASCAAPAQVVGSSRTPDPIQEYMNANSSQRTAVAAIEARKQTAAQQVMDLQSTQLAWNATSTADSIQSTTVAASTPRAIFMIICKDQSPN